MKVCKVYEVDNNYYYRTQEKLNHRVLTAIFVDVLAILFRDIHVLYSIQAKSNIMVGYLC